MWEAINIRSGTEKVCCENMRNVNTCYVNIFLYPSTFSSRRLIKTSFDCKLFVIEKEVFKAKFQLLLANPRYQ